MNWKSLAGEFRDFALKGNVIDLAVGVIIGAAFGKIVSSLTDDVLMPLIGFITGGGVDFTNKYVVLSGSEKVTEGMTLAAAKAEMPAPRPWILTWPSFFSF